MILLCLVVAAATDPTMLRGLMSMPPLPLLVGGNFDPNLMVRAKACDRDFSTCPAGFVFLGEIYGDGNYCGADKLVYTGPCGRDPVTFKKAKNQAKQRWAEHCKTYWPCVKCTRNYSGCPKKWTEKKDGRCRGPEGELEMFKILSDEAKEFWSQATGHYWPCLAKK